MSLTRNFELQVKLMKAADDQARQGAKLISGQGWYWRYRADVRYLATPLWIGLDEQGGI